MNYDPRNEYSKLLIKKASILSKIPIKILVEKSPEELKEIFGLSEGMGLLFGDDEDIFGGMFEEYNDELEEQEDFETEDEEELIVSYNSVPVIGDIETVDDANIAIADLVAKSLASPRLNYMVEGIKLAIWGKKREGYTDEEDIQRNLVAAFLKTIHPKFFGGGNDHIWFFEIICSELLANRLCNLIYIEYNELMNKGKLTLGKYYIDTPTMSGIYSYGNAITWLKERNIKL